MDLSTTTEESVTVPSHYVIITIDRVDVMRDMTIARC